MEENQKSPAPAELNRTTTTEGFTTLNISGHDTAAMGGIAADYEKQISQAARWFYWLAALSLVNAVAASMNSSWSFLAGLGITQFISGFALGLSEALGGGVIVVALAIDLFVAGIFVLVGYFAQRQFTWAFILGLTLYAFDGLIFFYFGDWLSLAFHAFVFYSIYRGLTAKNKLKTLQAEALATG